MTTFEFTIHCNDIGGCFKEIVKPADFMSVFGTKEPTARDIEEAAMQIQRYYNSDSVDVKIIEATENIWICKRDIM